MTETMSTPAIIREGFFFRAVFPEQNWRSMAVTSASQAGLMIERKFGKDAHRQAAEAFLASAGK